MDSQDSGKNTIADLTQNLIHRIKLKADIFKFSFALGFIILILFSFYPQYKFTPPEQNNSSNYWNDYWEKLENFYSGNRINSNQLYPTGEDFSSVGLIKFRINNGFTSFGFFSICLLALNFVFLFYTVFRHKQIPGFFTIVSSYILFFFIFSFFNNNPLISQNVLGHIIDIIVLILILTGYYADYLAGRQDNLITERIKFIRIILGIIGGILVLISTSYYFTGSNLNSATELTGFYPTIYVLVGIIIIIISFFDRNVFVISLSTMLFFLTLTLWFSTSIQSSLRAPGTGMILMIFGSLICMFNNSVAYKINHFIKYDFQNTIKSIKNGFSKK